MKNTTKTVINSQCELDGLPKKSLRDTNLTIDEIRSSNVYLLSQILDFHIDILGISELKSTLFLELPSVLQMEIYRRNQKWKRKT